MRDAANRKPAADAHAKPSLKARAIHELERYAVIAAYLWVLFALFDLHRQLIEGRGVSLWLQGFALINALVFGKVVLIGEAFSLGKGKAETPLAWVAIRKALIFAILLVGFHLVEEAIRGWFEGKPVMDAIVAGFSGSPAGIAIYGGVFFVVLIPLYLFEEAAGVLGRDAMWALFLRPGAKRVRLVEQPAE